MDKDLILAIDNGTQSVRSLLFDLQGNLVQRARIPIEPYFSTAPGLAEQHPEVFWQAVCDACQLLWRQEPSAQGVASWRHRHQPGSGWQTAAACHPVAGSKAHPGFAPAARAVGIGFSTVGYVSHGCLSAVPGRGKLA
jgi:hypothetical protein